MISYHFLNYLFVYIAMYLSLHPPVCEWRHFIFNCVFAIIINVSLVCGCVLGGACVLVFRNNLFSLYRTVCQNMILGEGQGLHLLQTWKNCIQKYTKSVFQFAYFSSFSISSEAIHQWSYLIVILWTWNLMGIVVIL